MIIRHPLSKDSRLLPPPPIAFRTYQIYRNLRTRRAGSKCSCLSPPAATLIGLYHDGHKPWRSQQWKREKLTAYFYEIAKFMTSLDKFHQVVSSAIMVCRTPTLTTIDYGTWQYTPKSELGTKENTLTIRKSIFGCSLVKMLLLMRPKEAAYLVAFYQGRI